MSCDHDESDRACRDDGSVLCLPCEYEREHGAGIREERARVRQFLDTLPERYPQCIAAPGLVNLRYLTELLAVGPASPDPAITALTDILDESGWNSPAAHEEFRRQAREVAEHNARADRIAAAKDAVIEAAKAWHAGRSVRDIGAALRRLRDGVDALTEAEKGA